MALVPLNIQGEDGDPGAPGAAATVTVGTVTTGNAGTSASVTNSGTSSAAVLNFTIPRGATGAAGTASLPGSGSTVNLATGNTNPLQIQVPESDANYTFTMDDATYGSSAEHFTIRLPRPADESTRHWLRITYKPKDRLRDVGHYAYNGSYSDLTGYSHAPYVDRAVIVEPSPEPGSICTIDYEWNVALRGWSVSHYTGDVRVLRYEPLFKTNDERFDVEFGLPVYMSPALASFRHATSPYSGNDLRSAYYDALLAIPIATRRLLGSRGVFVDLCLLNLEEGIQARQNQDGAYAGAAGVYSNSLYCASVQSDYISGLRGSLMQHEIGHAMDQHFCAATGWSFPNGTASGFYGPTGTIADDLGLLTIWNDIVTGPNVGQLEARFVSQPTEWIAQLFMLCWAPRITGYSGSATWTSTRQACTTSDTTKWDAAVAYLQDMGAVPDPLV